MSFSWLGLCVRFCVRFIDVVVWSLIETNILLCDKKLSKSSPFWIMILLLLLLNDIIVIIIIIIIIQMYSQFYWENEIGWTLTLVEMGNTDLFAI
jgi:hypothetical protein